MTIKILKKKLKEIKALGFIKTHRRGDTGIGKTLEDMLGIRENNIPLPDIGEVAELKAYRKSAVSMLTLFTLEPKPRGGDRDRVLLDNFGYTRRDNERPKELYSTLSCKRYNNQNLKLAIRKDTICIVGRGRELNICWEITDLERKFEEKLPALVYTLAESKEINEEEHFHFNEAYLLEGFDFETFKKMIRNDDIVVDVRMYYRPDGSVRNHGTAFRIKVRKLYNAFETKTRLL